MYCQRDEFQIPRRSIHAPSGQQTPLRGGLRRNKSARLQRWCGILLLQACAQKQNKRVRGIGGNGTGSMSTGGERGGQGGAQNPLMPTLRSRSRHRAELLCAAARPARLAPRAPPVCEYSRLLLLLLLRMYSASSAFLLLLPPSHIVLPSPFPSSLLQGFRRQLSGRQKNKDVF